MLYLSDYFINFSMKKFLVSLAVAVLSLSFGYPALAASQVSGEATRPAVTPVTAHLFYTSSYRTSRYYYCDTDSQWKGLSKRYLRVFSSQESLLREFPNRVLHKACR